VAAGCQTDSLDTLPTLRIVQHPAVVLYCAFPTSGDSADDDGDFVDARGLSLGLGFVAQQQGRGRASVKNGL
jgi:hypothetical protein